MIDGQNVETGYYWLIRGPRAVQVPCGGFDFGVGGGSQLRYNATAVGTGRAGCDAGVIANRFKR
jgi:hypothetical protein